MEKQRTKISSFVKSTEKMHLHPITLAFSGTRSHLEKQFLADYFIVSLPVFRFACIASCVLYALFGILDAYLIPEKKHIFWLIRYGFFCPLTAGMFLFSFSSLFKKIMLPIMACCGIAAGGGGIIMMILIASPPVSFSYYAGLILIFMMGYTVVKIRFIWASCTCWFLVFLYEYAAVFVVETPIPILVNNNFFFIAANLIGMLSCYSIEYYARRDFFLKTLLNAEREHVRQAKDMLEEKVQDRTAQLVRANTRITQEMNDRMEAEEENREIQAQLQRQQKMESLGLMAGGVAHDLNNILSGIISYPELILLDLPEDSRLRTPIHEIQKSGQRAAAVVADLLTVARGVASRYEIVCVNDLIRSYIQSPEYKKTKSLYPDISLDLDLDADLPNCKCSPVHIQKVLTNLVNNAFEAIELKGLIVLSTTSAYLDVPLLDKGEYLLLRVSDSGSGIPADILQHVFEPFYTKKVMGRSGTGLGLAVVWNTVQEHDGTVDVVSNDNGTTFTICLPVTREERPDVVQDAREDLQGTAKILVVDDERVQRDLGDRMLSKLGYQVNVAESGESAVAYLQDHEVDLVILDMLMDPGMSGYQTYRAIIALHPGQKALIVSGFSESADVKRALELGAGDFLKKPYSIDELGRAAKRVLA